MISDEDVISCLHGGSITTVPGPMVDAFAWTPCICDAEASIVAKEKTISIILS